MGLALKAGLRYSLKASSIYWPMYESPSKQPWAEVKLLRHEVDLCLQEALCRRKTSQGRLSALRRHK